MINYCESWLYYFSATICFNFLYFVKFINANGERRFSLSDVDIYYSIMFFLIILLLFLGIVATYLFFNNNDNIKHKKDTLGKSIEINVVEDITLQDYFSNYSLLVLTALSISTNVDNWWSILMYIFVYCTLGIVYIYNDMYYINPILYILKYKLYKINNDYYIISKNLDKNVKKIVVKNVDSKIYKV